MTQVIADLQAEQDSLDSIVSGLSQEGWRTGTPADGWDVRDQIGHLAFFDERAIVAIVDPEAFTAEVLTAAADITAYMARHLDDARVDSTADLLARWRTARGNLLEALDTTDPSTRLAWYGPEMSLRSFATARLMETWAHGQDIVDALGVSRTPTDRLEHIAFLGVRTMGWSFTVNGLDVPIESVRVSLNAPSGDQWTWNDDSTANVISGDAEDFCLVVTRRRHVSDTGLEVTGSAAERWMAIAQAFAGPPGQGRSPGQFG